MYVPNAAAGSLFPLSMLPSRGPLAGVPPAEVEAAVRDLFARYAGPSAAASAFAAAPAIAGSGAAMPSADALAALAAELRQRLQQLHGAGLAGGARARREVMGSDATVPGASAEVPAAAAEVPAAAAPPAMSPLQQAITKSSATWLRKPMKGPLVAELQQKLRAAGFDPGPVDGQFGPMTERAVLAFQRAAKITTDGKVGPQTLGALLGGNAPSGGNAPAGSTTPSAGSTTPAGTTEVGPAAGTPTSPTIDGMLSWAQGKIGTPYAAVNPFRFGNVPWDGKPHTSVNGSGTVFNFPKGTQVFDCSGFVVAAYREIGVDLAKLGATTSASIASSPHLQDVARSDLRPGDLITYKSSKGIGHVVIYLGNGQTIEASGGKGVHIGTVDWSRASAFKRVPLPGE